MGLALIGVLAIKYYFYPQASSVQFRSDSSTQGIYHFTADTSLYHFSSHEGKMPSNTNFFSDDFLHHVPVHIGEWVWQDIKHQFADISLFRLYRHKRTGEYLWFILVYGGHPSQFHSAEVCYIGDGWDVAKREIKSVQTDEDSFPMRYFIAQKQNDL